MSEQRNGAGKGLISSALLVAAVALILVAGMFLRSSEPAGARNLGAAAASPATSPPLGSIVIPEPPEAPAETPLTTQAEALPAKVAPPKAPRAEIPVDPLVSSLAARAQNDCERLGRARGRWTAQLMVACKPQTVDRLLDAAPGSTGIYVLPASVNDEACFRVCFGTYATMKDAAAAADLPKALRGKERIGAVEIGKVLP